MVFRFLFVMFLAFTALPARAADTVVLQAMADAYLRSGPNKEHVRFGPAPILCVKKSSVATDGFHRESYLKFDLGGVQAIAAGKLRLYCPDPHEFAAADMEILSSPAIDWTDDRGEQSITWANRPAAGEAVHATGTWALGWNEWDLTAFLQGEIAAGRNVVTLIVRNATVTTGLCVMNSREAAAHQPELRLVVASTTSAAPNFSSGSEAARKFGVQEVVLTGDGSVANPFDTIATVKFTPPSGERDAKTVHAFYDGEDTWRARVYVSEAGEWKWSSASATDTGLNGKSGTFRAADSKLRGRLLSHPKNPRQWMTEDGRWFLNLNDTAYFLLSPHTAVGEPVNDEDVKAYVRDAVAHGITSVRCFTLIGPGGYLEDGPNFARRWRDSVFDDDAFTRLRLPHFRVADERLRWLLDEYPDLYVQFVLFPRGSRYGRDDQMWRTFTPEQKARVMRYLIARYAAYPQLFWLVSNDAHYGPQHPHNNAFVREAGEYFRRHDPWRHPMATGHARKVEYFFGDEEWSSYIHLEDSYDLGATQYAKYQHCAKPVFLGEDRYEQDHPEDRDPTNMRYFQRRLFWAWLLSGGSTNYGGRWWVLVPYSQTGQRPTPSPWKAIAGGEEAEPGQVVMHTAQLVGLDSVKAIRDYFEQRQIELSDFEPDHDLVQDADDAAGARAPKLMRRGEYEFIIYHPNAAAVADRDTQVDATRAARLKVDLRGAQGTFVVEWYRAEDGAAQAGGTVAGGDWRELMSPWQGHDCVLQLRRE